MHKRFYSIFLLTLLTLIVPTYIAHGNSLTYHYSIATDYFSQPYNLAISPDDSLYVVDRDNSLKKFETNDIIDLDWEPSAELANLLDQGQFASLTLDSNNLYITLEDKRLLIVNHQGQLLNELTFEDLSWFCAITVDPVSNSLLLADNSELIRLDKSGEVIYKNKYAEFWQPGGIAVNSKGVIYVADTNNKAVKIFNRELELLSTIGGEESELDIKPYGVAIDNEDRVYISNLLKPEIYIFSPKGELLDIYSSEAKRPEEFNSPAGLAIRDEYLYVADISTSRVQKYKINFDQLSPSGDSQKEN